MSNEEKLLNNDEQESNNENPSIDSQKDIFDKTIENKISNSNETFFEKFEKTKKDFVKEKKIGKQKAQKSLKFKSKILGFENRLRDEDFIRNSWIAFIVLSILFVAYASVSLGFLGNKFNGASDKWIYANYYLDMTKTIVVFSSIILVIMPMPFLYLLGTWFVGINGTHKSKQFFIVILVFLVLSLILMLCLIPMTSIIFHKTIYFKPLINGSGGESSGGTGGDSNGGGSSGSTTPSTQSYVLAFNYAISKVTELF